MRELVGKAVTALRDAGEEKSRSGAFWMLEVITLGLNAWGILCLGDRDLMGTDERMSCKPFATHAIVQTERNTFGKWQPIKKAGEDHA